MKSFFLFFFVNQYTHMQLSFHGTFGFVPCQVKADLSTAIHPKNSNLPQKR